MSSSLGALRESTAAYIHVPFCAHRCGYCDFTLVAKRDDLIGQYLKALEIELRSLGTPRPVTTLFLGGGTPTQLSAPQLAHLLRLCRDWFRLTPDYEFSIEGNPARLDDDKVAVLVEYGINRVSLGAQSFDRDILQTLERDHDARTIEQAVERLAGRIDNVSLDLIFGVPGQSLSLWRDSLRRAIALALRHISTYGLTIEKGTTFWSRREKGTLTPVANELEHAMYAAAMDDLEAAGFAQYELSNFAQPGFACRHNQTYWAARSYYGFGPGAASYLGGKRQTNHRSVTTWLKRVLAGKPAVADAEELAPEDRAREALVLGLRRIQGVPRDEFAETTGFELAAVTAGRIEKHVASGLLIDSPSRLRLTRDGQFLADSVIVDLL